MVKSESPLVVVIAGPNGAGKLARAHGDCKMTTFPKNHPPSERIDDVPRILHAMRQGVRKALARHRERGNPIAMWRDGRVVWIPAEEIPVELTKPLPELK